MIVSILEWQSAPGGQGFMILCLGDENGRGCYRFISEETFRVEPWVLPLTRVVVYRPFFSSVSFDMEVNYASGTHAL